MPRKKEIKQPLLAVSADESDRWRDDIAQLQSSDVVYDNRLIELIDFFGDIDPDYLSDHFITLLNELYNEMIKERDGN
jgi:hypothetical protein